MRRDHNSYAGRTVRAVRIRIAVRIAILAAAVMGAGSAVATAQYFERSFGRTDDESGSSVQQTADGGFIVAGSTFDPVTGVALAYVVRTEADGTVRWERRFGLGDGTQTFGVAIRQLTGGDHLLVGTVGPVPNPAIACTNCVNVYAIRITDNGNLVWHNVYGTAGCNQYATSVVELSAPASGPDVVIAGYTDNRQGEYQGFLLRILPSGGVVWACHYDADPNAASDNRLMAVDECRVGAGAGDIVATGYVDMPGNGKDVWVLRVNGPDGSIKTTLQGAAVFGTSSDDAGYAITELRFGANPGDLAIAGESFGRPGASNREILMLETRPGPCDAAGHRADQFLGDAGPEDDYARGLVEITDPTLGTPGDIVATGGAYTRFKWMISNALFLQQFAQGTLTPVGQLHGYGGSNRESGASVDEVAAIASNAGLVAVGVTESSPPSPPGNLLDLYMVRTDPAMLTCLEWPYSSQPAVAGLNRVCVELAIISPFWEVLCGSTYDSLNVELQICP